MSLEIKGFEFGKFLLVPQEKALFLEGKPVTITPKAFDLLQILVENHGRLVERDKLLDAIWADSFVEEGNLTFTIRLLRKTLGDKTKDPRFIETVPKRGYRFISPVREVFDGAEPKAETEPRESVTGQAEEEPAHASTAVAIVPEQETPAPRSSSVYIPIGVAVVLLVTAIIAWALFVQNRDAKANPVLFAPFKSQKLSANGKVAHALLSPDGKSVFYTNGTVGDKQSIWRRNLETGENTEIMPPTDEWYAGLAISPDGNMLYFARRASNPIGQFDVYRISIFGGIPQKIIDQTQGWISVSPDGKSLSFVRCPYSDDEFCSLWTADSADGKNEKQLVVKSRPYRIGDNQFSPDGKSVAFAWGQSATSSNEFGVSEVNLETGAERELTPEKFFNVKSIAWLPDQSGLLLTAFRVPNQNDLIWKISVSDGSATPLTKDSESYFNLNLDALATKLVSTQVKQDFKVRLFSKAAPADIRTLTDGVSPAFSADGRIYFSSDMSGNSEIWSINPDGSGQRQLTNDVAADATPISSADGNHIFFTSNRTGIVNIWRMNADGSDQVQLTQNEGGGLISVSSDGQWVYYRHGRTQTLWRVSTKGDGEQMILDKQKSRFAVSPDGSLAGFIELRDDERILTIVSLSDGKLVKEFHLADRSNFILNITWIPDTKSLAYITSNRDLKNDTVWIQNMDSEKPQKITDLGDEEEVAESGLTLSPDGKTFAVVQGNWLHDAVLIEGLK